MPTYNSLVHSVTKKWTGLALRANIPVPDMDRFLTNHYAEWFESHSYPNVQASLEAVAQEDPRKAAFQLQYFAIQQLFQNHPIKIVLSQELTMEFRILVAENSQYGYPEPMDDCPRDQL